jgi:cytochrome c oxidase subunit III
MSARPFVPGAALPVKVSGSRHPLWWGMVMLIVIEIMVFGSLIVSYFYLKAGSLEWPPGGIDKPELLLPTINLFVLIISGGTMYWADSGIKKGDQRRLKIGLAVSWLLMALFLTLKVVEYAGLDYRWNTNAYGSIVWTITGFHSAHIISVLLKTMIVFALAWQGYFNADRRLGVQINGLYWQFVVIIWIPLYATLYLSPYLL